MANRLSNMASLFKDGRTRTIILVTLVVLIIAIVVGIVSMRGKKGVEASAGLSSAPGGIQSVPFQAPNKAYAELQTKQNAQKAKTAEQTGGSAIPTIVNSNPNLDKYAANAQNEDTGVGFTELNREQSDAGTFAAKSFNSNHGPSQCPTPEIPKNALTALGTPIYDQYGKLIGYADANGTVKDINGNIIGTMDKDGIVRDATGKIIGQKNKVLPGTPIYDDKGNIIGYTTADGKVVDAQGRVIGTVGPDGKVRDLTGKVLGTAGVPVYDKNGKLLGFAGPDGKIRDASGKVIGTVGPDGTAYDLNGAIIGKAGAVPPGTPVYGPDGKILGYVGPDGKVRDASGNIIGQLGADGVVRDINGHVIGSLVQPVQEEKPKPAEVSVQPATMTEAELEAKSMESLTQKEDKISKDQKLSQLMQQKQQAMNTQASQLMAAWTSPMQQYVIGEVEEKNQEKGSESAGGGAGSIKLSIGENAKAPAGPVFIKAGTVYYAVINTAINSDEPGPVMATIVSGDYKSGKLLGSMVNQGKAVLLSFNVLTLQQFSKSIAINAIAIDQNTARTALSTETDNHYLLRYGTLFASAFMSGYGQAVSSAGTTTTTSPFGGSTSVHSKLSGREEFFAALGNVGTQFGNQMNAVFNTPPTVYVAPGTAVGILFMSDVSLPSS